MPTESVAKAQPSESAPIPMLVLTRKQDHVESINATLRRAGHAVHCTWLPDATDIADALIQINPELLLVFADERLLPLEIVAELRARTQPPVPVIFVSGHVDETTTTAALRAGAQDVVSLAHPERLQLVCARELRAFRLERALNSTLSSAREYQRALAAFMAGSADAIAQVQEGILVDANPAWLELFGYSDADAVRGQPVMDLFATESHQALKGALAACKTGKWSNRELRVNARLSDGTLLPLQIVLADGEFEEEPVVRFIVHARRHDEQDIKRRLGEAVHTDPSTGLLHRSYLVEELMARVAHPLKAGVRFVACIRADRMEDVVAQVGPLRAEEFIAQLAALVREQSATGDLGGRFTGSSLLFLIERGTQRDVEAWAGHVVHRIGANAFNIGGRKVAATATVGLALVRASVTDPATPVADAVEAVRTAREQGGNRVHALDRAGTAVQAQAQDKIWVQQLKSALMENRFRLVQQPIASLVGEDQGAFDVVVRMLDEHGKEVLPSEFIPAAERNDLMKNIDRWVIGASMSFCTTHKGGSVFVRLSRDTVIDKSLPGWLTTQLKAGKGQPGQVCFQVTQEVADRYLPQTKELRAELKRQGFRFAIEHFGVGANSEQLVDQLKPDVVKIEGSLMQGLASDAQLQQRVKALVQIAKKHHAQTIAERVEDANTMAVLWQLGIEYIQGYFVHKPEEVVLG